MKNYKIINANIVNEGKIFKGDLFIENGIIKKITGKEENLQAHLNKKDSITINAKGKYILPGVIDDHVHFREPGLTYKADIYSESKAAVAGGITSFMEMPNTVPNTLSQELLEQKYELASKKSLANYSFYIGASDNNIEDILMTNPRNVCGIKLFMGASTGNMLVDDINKLIEIFSKSKLLIAVHCEDEQTIQNNIKYYRKKYGDNAPVELHPLIRSEEACFKSSELAVSLAKKYNTRLHILHLSTARETELFDNTIPLKDKHITAEVCIHHLWFNNNDYKKFGALIKWNPAIKTEKDRETLFNTLLNDKMDLIATDHAPHTIKEKNNTYFKAPSGGPMVQHSLPAMLEFYHNGKISLEKIVEKMCHAPAICFNIEKRGFIREGYQADLVLINLDSPWKVEKSNILYKCGWSPFEGYAFKSKITHTFVNGHLAFENGYFNENIKGQRLLFDK
ncbi:MAG: dihydroorotase [Bacteroidales bacterium]|nr:dihydroorotase [Bacteroidales bacterium]